MERSRDYGNERSGSVQAWEFVYRLSDCQLLRQDSVLWPSRCSGGLHDPVSLVRRRQLRTFSLSPYISAASSVQYSRTFRIGPTLKGLCFTQLRDGPFKCKKWLYFPLKSCRSFEGELPCGGSQDATVCVWYERCWCTLMELRCPPVRAGGKRRGMWKSCPSATLCTANHNLLAWNSTLGLRGERLATCCLNDVAAWRLR